MAIRDSFPYRSGLWHNDEKISRRFSLCFLTVLTCLVYFPTIGNEFCLDDSVIFSAPYPKNLKDSLSFFTDPVPHGLIWHYRPIVFWTFAVDGILWRDSPAGYHLTNLCLAVLCVIACFFFLSSLLDNDKQALIASAFFAVLPGHSEAVIGIYNRSQVLSGLFIFWALLYFFKVIKAGKISRLKLMLSGILTLFGCFAKEIALVIPLLSCMMIFCYRPPKSLYKNLAGGIMLQIGSCLFYLVLRSHAIKTLGMAGVDNFIKDPTISVVYFTSVYIAFQYVLLVFFPVSLSCDYPLTPVSFHWSGLVLPVLLLFALYLGIRNKKDRTMLFCIFWFVTLLLPVLHLIPMQIALAERLLYPASMGMILLAVLSFSYLSQWLEQKKRFWGQLWIGGFFGKIPWIIVAIFALITGARCLDWKSNHTLWRQTLKSQPSSYRAWIYLGTEAARQENYLEAFRCYKEAFRLNPNRDNKMLIYQNTAILFLTLNKIPEAEECVDKLLELYPQYGPAWILLGDIRASQKKWPEALEFYRQAGNPRNRWDRDYARLLAKKGNCFAAMEEWEKALKTYQDALYFAPEDASIAAKIKLVSEKLERGKR